MFLGNIKLACKYKKKKIKKSTGRNNKGRITVRHRGGGHKRLIRHINWTSELKDSLLIGLQYNTTSKISLYQWYNVLDKKIFFTPAFQGNSILDINTSFRYHLSHFEIGEKVNNISSFSDFSKSIYIKSPGVEGTVIQRYTSIKNYVLLQLPSTEYKLFFKKDICSSGSLAGYTNMFEKIKKAGRQRWLNRRPKVRGVAMNPIDHPHGGGEGKTSGGRPSVSPWGKLTKNVKTRKNKRTSWRIFTK